MTALPPILRPWAMQLSLFPDDLALTLGPHVARLSAALGGLRPRGEAEGGEPQGYDGLTRRGPFDRLLVSEWLWALDTPDELVRRAAFGELSFLKPAFRQPQGARRTVVLLDAGPDQLGLPRIAHLALLIVLARRAEAAGAAFIWGALQSSPESATHSGLEVPSLLKWLEARSIEPASARHLAAWREALELQQAPGDAWLVGAARLSRLAGAEGMSRVEVSEPMEPGAHRLTVDVRPASQVARSVVLELPPPDDCIRLLRNPFERRTVAPVWTRKDRRLTHFAFSGDGRRILMHHSDGSVAAMAVPHSPRATVPKPRRVQVPGGQHVIAVGWRYSGGLLVLARQGNDYVMHGQVRTSSGFRKVHYQVASEVERPESLPGMQSLPLVSWQEPNGQEHLWLKDAQDGLFHLPPPGRDGVSSLLRVDEKVSALAEVLSKPVYVTRPQAGGTGRAIIARLGVLGEAAPRMIPLNARHGEAYFGYSPSGGHAYAGLLVVRHQEENWRLFLDMGVTQVVVPSAYRVVGAVQPPAPSPPGVLALDPDRRTFHFFSEQAPRTLVAATDEVVQAAASHGQPVFGWLTKTGELVLWDLMEQTVLYRAVPESTS
ncbi:hypothetical protein D7X74_20445 [Corallococcus sp. CA047B]|uniref:LpqB family beta-propeller domain-containing protein n=1 Tax=Corallococcus sp. CA047B TaxID=2316729 RepID=UPI000EA10BD7|nr:LpqB family beta-propeller domain-containing protein [Corallococcus sp. CA047B]RKH14232.1 hypothetical protein D7X74_20445 [Corallococcus sp. CA047B]